MLGSRICAIMQMKKGYGMKYKISKYNIIVKDDNGEDIYYNSYVRRPVRFKNKKFIPLEELFSSEAVDKIPADTLQRLAETGLIVPENIREEDIVDYELKKVLYSDRKLELTILPTDGCNFDCVYCYQSEPYHIMKEAQIEGLYKYLEKNLKSFDSFVVDWFGGEPLLVKDVVMRVNREMKEIARQNNVSYIGRMTTNGSLLDLETFEALVNNHVLYYQITIDGPEQIHNKQRPLKNGGNSFSAIIENLKRIRDCCKSNLFNITIRINITREILESMDDFLTMYKEEFNEDSRFTLSFEPVQDWGGKKVQDVKGSLVMDFKDYFDKMDEAMKDGINLSVGFAKNKDAWICVACKSNGYVLNYNGELLKCTMGIYDENEQVRDSNRVGFISESGKMVVDEKKIAAWMRDNKTEKCLECRYYPLCGGIECPYAINFKNVGQCYKMSYFKTLVEKQIILQSRKQVEII